MGTYSQKKRENLDLILKTIGQSPAGPADRVPLSADGSFAGKPLLLWLESTARCNLRCSKCGHAFDPPGTDRTLPRNLADAVLDEADEYFAAAVKVRTSGYGEMFLYSRLRALVERIKRYECWAEGTTNGVVIAPSEVDWLVQLGYDQLVFSIDGAEPSTMQRLRGADLNRIWEILGYIRRRKEEWGSTKPQIVVGFVAQSDNLHELPDLVRKLREFNVSFLAVNTLHYKKYTGPDDFYGRVYRDFSLANLERARVEALIEEGRLLAEEANIGYGVYIDVDRVYREAASDAESDPELRSEEGELITISAGTRPAPPPPAAAVPAAMEPFYCVYPWSALFVTARGSTTVCCSMSGDVGTVLNSGDLDRVWNGQALRDIRQSIARGEVHPQCAYCVSRNRHLSSFVDLDSVKAALALQEEPALPAGAPVAEVPAGVVFGYFDTRDLVGRSRERIRIAGWIASGSKGAPVREIKLRLGGRDLDTVRHFHARPDVVAYYGRKDLLYSGWQSIVIPARAPPRPVQLIAEATDAEGTSGALDPMLVHVTA